RPGRQRRVLPVAAPGRAGARPRPRVAGHRGRTAVNAKRTGLVVAHVGRPAAPRRARRGGGRLTSARGAAPGPEPEAADLRCAGADVVPATSDAAQDAEMVIVLGGDGTLLRAAEMARPAGAALLGVNLGHVGFLAETEPDDLAGAVDQVVGHRYA